MKINAMDLLVALCFLFFSFLLYVCFLMTVPMAGDAHGLLVTRELPTFSRTALVQHLLSGSAVLCALLGILLMEWAPRVTPISAATLWGATYFFIWYRSVFEISSQTGSFELLGSFGMGLVFIFLWFILFHHLGSRSEDGSPQASWKGKAVHYWIWGWMFFYFGLSALLAFNAVRYAADCLSMALGAAVMCFLNYLLCLFMKKTSGQEIEGFSRRGRTLFGLWLGGLVLAWIGREWMR